MKILDQSKQALKTTNKSQEDRREQEIPERIEEGPKKCQTISRQN